MNADGVTLEIVERYLCATGWTLEEENEHLYWCRAGSCSLPVLRDAEAMAALVARRAVADVRFLLGICVSAEHILEHARTIRRNNPEIGRQDHVSAATEGARLVAAVLQVDAEELLRKAGVDPVRWESVQPTSDLRGLAARESATPYYDPVTGRCPHGTRAPHQCRDGCEDG